MRKALATSNAEFLVRHCYPFEDLPRISIIHSLSHQELLKVIANCPESPHFLCPTLELEGNVDLARAEVLQIVQKEILRKGGLNAVV